MTSRAALLGALCALACGRAPDRTPAPRADSTRAAARGAQVVTLRGTLFARDTATFSFVTCGTTTERAVRVRPGARLIEAITAVNGGIKDSVFAEFDADTAAGQVSVREMRFATSYAEGSQCDRPRRSFDIEATGTEPFWHVTLDSAQLVLERPEGPLELAFVADTAVVRGALTTWLAHRDEGRIRELKFGVLREGCRDGMSDAWYPFRAEVRFGTIALHGCARR